MKRDGFTLIELLVAASIIALLIALLLPALRTARQLAREIRATSDVRQLAMGYSAYYVEHDGRLLYGHPPPSVHGQPIDITLPSGLYLDPLVARRYPWRLAPYVSNVWRVIHGYGDPPPEPQGNTAADYLNAYALSINPTYGLNSIYVGGHDGQFQGFINTGTTYRENFGAHAVFAAEEIRRPSDLILFGDAQRTTGPVDPPQPQRGLHYLTPPRARGHRWSAIGDDFRVQMPGHIHGLPRGRYSDAAVIAFCDGHAAALRPRQLDHMRLWANDAHSNAYDFEP